MVLVSSAERNYQERIRLERMRDNSNPFELAEEKFQKLFRLPRSAAFQLVSDLDDQRLDEGFIPKHLKVLSALQFFAQGSYQAAVGQDNFIALSQPSVSRCIKITADLIVEKLLPNCIKFPMTESEKLIAMTEFQELFNMPNTLEKDSTVLTVRLCVVQKGKLLGSIQIFLAQHMMLLSGEHQL
ncbi:unnamed protein product [Arctia plantaginis]|uniref:Nuclease HARBI1 n=1 Tax=Arctia plantaginis TaxID=874455 RepID=A0A8S0Z8R2_ARCPL|nr:unnamed protein product [Arctia plantaginis]